MFDSCFNPAQLDSFFSLLKHNFEVLSDFFSSLQSFVAFEVDFLEIYRAREHVAQDLLHLVYSQQPHTAIITKLCIALVLFDPCLHLLNFRPDFWLEPLREFNHLLNFADWVL